MATMHVRTCYSKFIVNCSCGIIVSLHYNTHAVPFFTVDIRIYVSTCLCVFMCVDGYLPMNLNIYVLVSYNTHLVGLTSPTSVDQDQELPVKLLTNKGTYVLMYTCIFVSNNVHASIRTCLHISYLHYMCSLI